MTGFDRFCVLVSYRPPVMSKQSAYLQADNRREVYPDSEFALVVKRSGKVVRSFPIDSVETLAHSTGRFLSLLPQLDGMTRDCAAAALLGRHEVFDVTPPKALTDIAKTSADLSDWEDSSLAWDANMEAFYAPAPKVTPPPELPKTSSVAGVEADEKRVQWEKDPSELRKLSTSIVARLKGFGLQQDAIMRKVSGKVLDNAGEIPRVEGHRHIRDRADQTETGNCVLLSGGARTKVAEAYRTLADSAQGETSRANMEKIAEAVLALDKEVQPRGVVPVYEALFCPLGDKTSGSQAQNISPVIYSFAQTMIREEDLERLPKIRLDGLENYLPFDAVQELRTDPVAAFQKLRPEQKKLVAQFVEERIKIPMLIV